LAIRSLISLQEAGPTVMAAADRLPGKAGGGRSIGIDSFLEHLIIETIIDAYRTITSQSLPTRECSPFGKSESELNRTV
jgi:hypothetical protein